jgi:flagellar motor switch protein FliN/FliY
MSPLVKQLAQAASSRFVDVMQSVVTPKAEAFAFDGPVTPGWLVPCELSGPITGTWYLAVSGEDAGRLAARVLMSETATDEETAEALKELVAQAVSAIGLESPFTGLGVKVGMPVTAAAAPGTASGAFGCRLDEATALHVACSFVPGAAVPAPAPSAPAAAAAGARGAATEKVPDNLSLILDIDMPLTVRFGEAVVTIEALSKLGPGSLVELSRQPDDPVDLLINGRLVARGEVVVVAGNYGVRVTQVVSADERMRTLNA